MNKVNILRIVENVNLLHNKFDMDFTNQLQVWV